MDGTKKYRNVQRDRGRFRPYVNIRGKRIYGKRFKDELVAIEVASEMRQIIDAGRDNEAMKANPRKYVKERLNKNYTESSQSHAGEPFVASGGAVEAEPPNSSRHQSESSERDTSRRGIETIETPTGTDFQEGMKPEPRVKLETLVLSLLDSPGHEELADWILDLLEVFDDVRSVHLALVFKILKHYHLSRKGKLGAIQRIVSYYK